MDFLKVADAHLGVNPRALQLAVTEKLLDDADVSPVFEHVGGAAVPEEMAGTVPAGLAFLENEGDVLVADRFYSGYEVIAGLRAKRVHFIGRTHQTRKIDFRKGLKINANERLVTWEKPRRAPAGSRLSQAQWEA